MNRFGRARRWALLIATGGFLLQAFPTGCNQFLGATVLTSFDFCSVLNCDSSTFFGFCEPVPVLIDCPNIEAAEG